MSEKKISIIILGSGKSLKKALITNIIGKDLTTLSKKRNNRRLHLYENDTYDFRYTPCNDMASENIKELVNKDPDMCLLVVEDGFSPEDVWQQIENLNETTGKSTDEFIVVLPLVCEHEKSYQFKFRTTEEIVRDVRKLAQDRHLKATKKSSVKSERKPNEMTNEPLFTKGKSGTLTHSGNKVNLVLLGMAGTGKSASGNTILGKEPFFSEASSNPVTRECQVEETVIKGKCVRVIDTPDIFDDEIKSLVKNPHVVKCKELLQSEPRVYLLVMNVGRLADGERDILKKLEEAFGSRAKEQTVILFTRGEELSSREKSLRDFLCSCNSVLKNIVEQCGKRCVVFENNAPQPDQVAELMQIVNMMLNKEQKQ